MREKKECRGGGGGGTQRERKRDRRRQREANANRSVVDSLRLRATDAELIKNRLTSLSRRTIWSRRNPVALIFSARKKDGKRNRQNNKREKKTNGECGAGNTKAGGNTAE